MTDQTQTMTHEHRAEELTPEQLEKVAAGALALAVAADDVSPRTSTVTKSMDSATTLLAQGF